MLILIIFMVIALLLSVGLSLVGEALVFQSRVEIQQSRDDRHHPGHEVWERCP